jgi:hypothetical protein
MDSEKICGHTIIQKEIFITFRTVAFSANRSASFCLAKLFFLFVSHGHLFGSS